MKTFFKWFVAVVLILFFGYIIGPKPPKPIFAIQEVTLPATLTELDRRINESERSVIGLKPDNEARIVWADSSKKEKRSRRERMEIKAKKPNTRYSRRLDTQGRK